MRLPDLSKESLVNFAAYTSLLLTVALVLWPKFAELVKMVWHSFTDAVRAVRHFRREWKSPVEPSARSPVETS